MVLYLPSRAMAIRVLSVLNYSNRRNPLADSGVQLQCELMTAILRERSDFFFYLLIPRELAALLGPRFRRKNVQLVSVGALSRQQGGAYHLDLRELSSVLDLNKVDVDVLFVNQPELTAGLLNHFNKTHFFDVHSVGYVHWMDWQRSDNVKNRWNDPSNLSILTSILLSNATGCNSQYGKRRILGEAGRWFNQETLNLFEKRIVPLRPGVDVREVVAARTASRYEVTTIIFPCRTQKYTGFKSIVEVHLAKLWRKRKDFRLLVTNPSDYDYIKNLPERYPFIEVMRFDRAAYLKALWHADIVVGSHNGTNQWSLAIVEALAAECIPLFNQESFLPELLLDALPISYRDEVDGAYFYYRGEFAAKLEGILDNITDHRKRMKRISTKIRKWYSWDSRVGEWIRCLEAADQASPELTAPTGITREMERFIRKKRTCSKEDLLRHLDWHAKSRHISWTRYRKYLRSRFSEDSRSPEVLFSRRRGPRAPDSREPAHRLTENKRFAIVK